MGGHRHSRRGLTHSRNDRGIGNRCQGPASPGPLRLAMVGPISPPVTTPDTHEAAGETCRKARTSGRWDALAIGEAACWRSGSGLPHAQRTQSTVTARAAQTWRIRSSPRRPRRLVRTAIDTLSTESRFTTDACGTGSSAGSSSSLPSGARPLWPPRAPDPWNHGQARHRVAGVAGHLVRSGSHWLARFPQSSGRYASRTFDRKFDAQRWLDEQNSERNRGIWTDPQRATQSFGAVADVWMKSRRSIADSTRARDDS